MLEKNALFCMSREVGQHYSLLMSKAMTFERVVGRLLIAWKRLHTKYLTEGFTSDERIHCSPFVVIFDVVSK